MASLFKADVPQQNPAVAKQQQDEQERAKYANMRAQQDQLTQETLLRSRRLGARSLLIPSNPVTSSILGKG
jgi:hypothetical protein